MTTGERIKQARLAANMTQAELGAKVGVKFSAIHKYESGMVDLKRSTIAALADALGVRGSWLMGYESEDLSEDEKRLLRLFRAMTADRQAALMTTAEAFAK